MTNRRVLVAGLIGLAVSAAGLCGFGALKSAQASPAGDAPHGTVTLDGMTVPDIGPLPTSVPTPPTNLNYKAKVDLGKQLYFDGRLSKSGAISCAFCHNPGTGFADPRQTSIGIGGGLGGRQSPTVYNTAFNHLQFWDGRSHSLEEQALGPIQNSIEMANALIAANKQYDTYFYPNRNHGIGGGNARLHLYNKMTNFIIEKL